MQQGKAMFNYTPFHTTKRMCADDDESCDLALEPEERKRSKPARSQVPPDLVTGYPPIRISGAKVVPEWLSGEEWLEVRALRSRGKNILEIADAVGKNASRLRLYIDTYLSAYDNGSPLPSAKSTDSSSSTAGSTETEDGLFPLDHQVAVPQQGMPHPAFLNRQEQEIAWKMFQQHKTIRDMTERLHKNRHKLSQYINAYLRPKLLELQAKEREAENAATPTPITPLTKDVQFPLYNPTVAAPPRSTPPVGDIPQASQSVTPIAAAPEPTSSQEPSVQGTHHADFDAFQSFDNPLLVSPPAAMTNGDLGACGTPKGTSDEDSLFGDSPGANKNYENSYQLASTQHELESAQQIQRKRKCEDDHEGEKPAEPRRASKRPRHRSLP